MLQILWHDRARLWQVGAGHSRYTKRRERGRFIRPTPADGAVEISASPLDHLLDGIDWRNPRAHLATGCGRAAQACP